MLGWFRRPTYDLLIEAERITLADESVHVHVEPRLALATDGRIIGVGDRTSNAGERILELFAPIRPSERPQFEERLAAFVAIFRHLMSAAQKPGLFTIRPNVRVHGASLLRPLFKGAEQQFLLDALLHAGATKVEFAG